MKYKYYIEQAMPDSAGVDVWTKLASAEGTPEVTAAGLRALADLIHPARPAMRSRAEEAGERFGEELVKRFAGSMFDGEDIGKPGDRA